LSIIWERDTSEWGSSLKRRPTPEFIVDIKGQEDEPSITETLLEGDLSRNENVPIFESI
jgi:hypothetical protein